MKKYILFPLSLIFIFISCVSMNDRTLAANELSETQVIGSVEVEFNSFQFFHIPDKSRLKRKAYAELTRVAKDKYEGAIEIKNIAIRGNWTGLEMLNILGYTVGAVGATVLSTLGMPENGVVGGLLVIGLSGNTQKIIATGDVVAVGASRIQQRRSPITTGSTATGIERALTKAAEQTLINVPKKVKIAIVFITAPDKSTTDFIAGELEFLWVNDGYIITDRSELDRLRLEQNFQLSGEVDDATAVSIGRFAGADIIVTGRVDGEGELRRLRLRAINTQTAQVVGVASERM